MKKQKKNKYFGGTNKGLDRNRFYSYDERSGSNPSGVSSSLFQAPDTSTQELALEQLSKELADTLSPSTSSGEQVDLSSVVTRSTPVKTPSELSGFNVSDPFLRGAQGQPIGSRADYVPPAQLDPFIRGAQGTPIGSRNISSRYTGVNEPVLRFNGQAIASNASYNRSIDPYIRSASGDVIGVKPNVENYFKTLSTQAIATPATILPQNKGISSPAGAKYSPFGRSGVNRGTDLLANIGDQVKLPSGRWEVLSVFDGARRGVDERRADFGVNGGWGNSVLVRNSDTGETLRFSHLDVNGVNIGANSVGSVLPGGTVVGRVGVTGRTTGPHLDLEYTKNGRLSPVEKSSYAGELFPSGGGKDKNNNWYKGIGGPGDVKYELDKEKKDKSLLERFGDLFSSPVTSATTEGPGLFTNALYNLQPRLAPGTQEDVDLINTLTNRNPSDVGLISSQTPGSILSTTGNTPAINALGERVEDVASYQGAVAPIYSDIAKQYLSDSTNDFNPGKNAVDTMIANRGLSGKGLNQNELEALRANVLAADTATRNNLFTTGAATRAENIQGAGRLREYLGRGRRDLSGTQAGRDLSQSFSEASQDRINDLTNALNTAQAGIESSLASNVGAVRGQAQARQTADRNTQLQAALADAQRLATVGTPSQFLEAKQAERRDKINALADQLATLQSGLITQSAKLNKGKTPQENAANQQLYNIYLQRIEDLKQQLQSLGLSF